MLWGSVTFGEDQGNELRRLTSSTGAIEAAPLPAPSQRDGFARPVLATAADGGTVFYLLSGHTLTGEPGCSPRQPCTADPGCSGGEPCTVRVAQGLVFAPVTRAG